MRVHPPEDLAARLRAGLHALQGPIERARAEHLAAQLELYGRVALRTRESRLALGLEPVFQAATAAWVKAGPSARERAFQGLRTDELLERTHKLATPGQVVDEDEVLSWAAMALRAALVQTWLEPADRARVQEALSEVAGVADTWPMVFLGASGLAQALVEAEPVERWPRPAAELLRLFSRLPLLAVVDGEL